MMPFTLSFRRLILKYIPQLKPEDVDRYESLLALRFHLRHERNYDPVLTPLQGPDVQEPPEPKPPKKPPVSEVKSNNEQQEDIEDNGNKSDDMKDEDQGGNGGDNDGGQNSVASPDKPEETPYQKDISSKLEHVSGKAKDIIAPVALWFNLVHRLWIARQQFALEQGHFLQVPPTVEGLARFAKAAIRYAVVSVITLPRLEFNRIKYFVENTSPVGVIVGIGLIVLTVVAIDVLGSGGNGMPPQISDLPGFSISEGDSFPPLSLDNFVTDPDDALETLTWAASSDNELTVSIDENRVATINIPNPDWNGQELITFTVADPAGLSDSAQTTFTVDGVNDLPKITSTPVDSARVGSSYEYQVIAQDPDLLYGDVLKYTLIFAPDTLRIDSLSGLVSGVLAGYYNEADSVGVQVTDSEGESDIQKYTLIVVE